MPIVKVQSLPPMSEKQAKALRADITVLVTSIEELCLNGKNAVSCIFSSNVSSQGPSDEIIVEVILFAKPERTDQVRDRLANELKDLIRETFPKTSFIECLVWPFDPRQGYAFSRL